jgi:hypothetical protein
MTTNQPITDDFIFPVYVGAKQYKIDGMLVMAELALSGSGEMNTDNATLINVVRKCITSDGEPPVLTDAEALAIGLRVSMRLQNLGKGLAP